MESEIPELKKQVSFLEQQKTELQAEKEKLTTKGDELSLKIEILKMQPKGGLGIIGKYRLSRNLRKAQALSEKIQSLERKINEAKSELKNKRGELKREYENQIASLLEKLNGTSETEAKREILEKLKEYQTAKEQLEKPEKKELEHLDMEKIEIKEYDAPQEIREKADLINDFANKLNDGIETLNARIKSLQEEVKTRKKLGEFAEEISFFGERISREEIADNTGEEPGEGILADGATEESVEIVATFSKDANDIRQPTMPVTDQPVVSGTQPPADTEASAASSRIIMEHNGVSAAFVVTSLERFEEEIKLLEKRKQEWKNRLLELSEKADSFHKKADEIEKSETKAGEKTR